MLSVFKFVIGSLWSIICVIAGAVGFYGLCCYMDKDDPGYTSRRIAETIEKIKAAE